MGLSGGVDSAVSAWLLKQQGHEVVGIFMKNWEDDDDGEYCSSNADFVDAAAVAALEAAAAVASSRLARIRRRTGSSRRNASVYSAAHSTPAPPRSASHGSGRTDAPNTSASRSPRVASTGAGPHRYSSNDTSSMFGITGIESFILSAQNRPTSVLDRKSVV